LSELPRRATAALRHVEGLGPCAARAEQVHAHLGRRREEKAHMSALDAQIRQAAHDNAQLQGQLQQVQTSQRRAEEQYRAQVTALLAKMEATAAAERQKAEVLFRPGMWRRSLRALPATMYAPCRTARRGA
jgi:hypothetical protein